MRSLTGSLRVLSRARAPFAPALFGPRRALSHTETGELRAHVDALKQQGADAADLPDAPAPANAAEDTGSGELWQRRMEARYGEGSYQLFRPLYKDLCDEMRREYFTKPPPPPPRVATPARPPEKLAVQRGSHQGHSNTGSSSATPDAAGESVAEWTVSYHPASNCAVFSRGPVSSTRQARVVAYSRVEVKDPPRLNALLTFADWCPFEVMVERRGVIVHFSVACNEGGMHLRNVRAYRSPAGEGESARDGAGEAVDEGPEARLRERLPRRVESAPAVTPAVVGHGTPAHILDVTDDAEWCRQNLCYDGPCLWHVELDFLNELYDVMQDHGITLDWMRWATEWVYYFEHQSYAYWAVGMLEELIPSAQRGPEEDFLTEKERAELDEPAEDWLSARGI